MVIELVQKYVEMYWTRYSLQPTEIRPREPNFCMLLVVEGQLQKIHILVCKCCSETPAVQRLHYYKGAAHMSQQD